MAFFKKFGGGFFNTKEKFKLVEYNLYQVYIGKSQDNVDCGGVGSVVFVNGSLTILKFFLRPYIKL